MRIALVHSFYHPRVPGGENSVVRDEAEALEAAGHEVLVVGAHTEDLENGPSYQLGSAYSVASGRGRSPIRKLEVWQPDVTHVHNTFPNFGRNWASDWGGPLVHTLHNFRPLCARAVLYRDGSHALCPDGEQMGGPPLRLLSGFSPRHGPSGLCLCARCDARSTDQTQRPVDRAL